MISHVVRIDAIEYKTSKGGFVQMTNDTQFKKEVQGHKKDYQEKKVELISRLCTENTPNEKKNGKLETNNKK